MFRGLHIVPPETRIDFMRLRVIAFVLSSLMVVGSIGLIAVKGLNFGIDFRGGILMEVKTPGPADLASLRGQLSALGLGEVALQEFGAADAVLIRIQRQEGDETAQLRAVGQVKEALGDRLEYRRTEFVGPKVGRELIEDAVLAVVLALGGIAAYIWFRYEWQFGINAIVATFHDCITTVGLFALLGLEFNLTTVAAVLTIAGYSVNDTVVIYDRVREELRRYKKMPLYDLINMAVNKTLSRTVVTSGLTLLSVLALYGFGGEVLRGFSLAMIWGIVIGSYSTVFIATPLLLYMNLRRGGSAPVKAAEDDSKPAAEAPGGGA
ncbi:MAG: protein translocase subunit SecF [Dongiaceae bacterium]